MSADLPWHQQFPMLRPDLGEQRTMIPIRPGVWKQGWAGGPRWSGRKRTHRHASRLWLLLALKEATCGCVTVDRNRAHRIRRKLAGWGRG